MTQVSELPPATSSRLAAAVEQARAHLLSLRNSQGHWEGRLSSSALSTATAVVALTLVDEAAHAERLHQGRHWLVAHQNPDGGWGDTTISKTNLSTTLLCWSALSLGSADQTLPEDELLAVARCEAWLRAQVGSLDPDEIAKAVVARYGKDKTFSVPILMTCALGGRLGSHREAWRRVLPLPFELAALPRRWFGAVGLPVVSYALPALIAIGHARFFHEPPAIWNPLRWLRGRLWGRIRPMLKTLQPSSGGYLEATPLTSFVTMALAGSGQKDHPCVPLAVEFLLRSQRSDGSWPIDTNLATWGTTLSVKALLVDEAPSSDFSEDERAEVKRWLLGQQYKVIHPFTNAAPGGWAWTDLPGGVPDADDTSGALVALHSLVLDDAERKTLLPTIEAGIRWLLDLQNRDGGMPTFCRGWGTLPFDRSTSEISAHALWAWQLWRGEISPALQNRIEGAQQRALHYLSKTQRHDGSWIPLWFGNEHATEEENPVHGTTQVVLGLATLEPSEIVAGLLRGGVTYLLHAQHEDGSWGGDVQVKATLEETANAVSALSAYLSSSREQKAEIQRALEKGAHWLTIATEGGRRFPASPIGLYFARLWYHETLYPVIWTLAALSRAQKCLGN